MRKISGNLLILLMSLTYAIVDPADASDSMSELAKEICDEFEEDALLGRADAHAEIANCYLFGTGRELDPEAAESWLIKGRDLGSEQAMISLASMYLFSSKDEKKHEAAVADLDRIVSASGDGTASFALALAYRNGLGVSSNESQSNQLFLEAAEEGHLLATFVVFGQIVLQESPDRSECSLEYWQEKLRSTIQRDPSYTVEQYKRLVRDDPLVTSFVFDGSEIVKITNSF